MTDYVEYKPPADGVAPRGWQAGMVWGISQAPRPMVVDPQDWAAHLVYKIPAAALHYPIVPYEGEEDGPDIAVNGKPDWLAPEQKFSVTYNLGCITVRTGHTAEWSRITKIRLPASHGYYADNPASDEVAITLTNVEIWQTITKELLPAIEAAEHSVTFAPDLVAILEMWEQRYHAVPDWRLRPTRDDQSFVVALTKTREALSIIRSRVRPVL